MVESYVAQNSLESIFGGSYIDHLAGGKLAVRFTQGVETHRAAVLAAAQHPDRLRVLWGRSSEAELRRVAAQIHADRTQMRSDGLDVAQVHVDIFNNQIALSLCEVQPAPSFAPDPQQYLTDRYPTVDFAPPDVTDCLPEQREVAYEYVAEVKGQSGSYDDDLAAPPYHGGIQVGWADRRESPNGCSFGFSVDDPRGTQNGGWGAGILTARHCWHDPSKNYELPKNPYPQARHGKCEVKDGKKTCRLPTRDVVAYSDDTGENSKSDAAVIDVNDAERSDKIYTHYGSEWLRPVKGAAKIKDTTNVPDTPSSDFQVMAGTIVCMVGRKSGGHCGKVTSTKVKITTNEHDYVLPNGEPNNMVYDDLLSVDMRVPGGGDYHPRPIREGDSGGPVFASSGRGQARQIWAMGLVYGSDAPCVPSPGYVGCDPNSAGDTLYVSKLVNDLKFDDGRMARLKVASQ